METESHWESAERSDLRHYWNVVNRHKWAIIGLALTAGVLTTLVVFAITPIYRATTTLLIESEQANIVSIEEIYGLNAGRQEYFETQFEILRSRPIAKDVVDTLKLYERPEFAVETKPSIIDWRSWLPFAMPTKQGQTEADPRDRAVDSYAENLVVTPISGTQLVRVQFESPDAAVAAQAANEHAQAYIESMLNARVAVTDVAATWMTQRAEQMRQELLASELQLQEFREQEQLVDVEGLRALPSQEINDLSSRLLEVRQTLSAKQIAYVQVTQASAPGQSLQGIPAILANESVRQFQEAEGAARRAVAEVADRYGPMHPRMIAAQAELADATENLERQRRSVAEGIRNDYEAARSEEAAIVAALGDARQSYQVIGRKESDLNSLQRAVDTNRQLYELFYNRLGETAATGDLKTALARIVEPAEAPRFAAKPNKGRTIAIAVFLTLLFGIGVAFLLDSLDNSVRTVGDVEEKLKRPLLARVPLLKDKMLEAVSTLDKNSRESAREVGFSEAMRTIRTSISLDNLDNPHNIILVTSSMGSEGKSLVALNLALAFAQSEKTLLIDADMRRPTIGAMAGVPRDAPGLSELLADRTQLKECVIHTGIDNLHVLATGFLPPDPLQLLSSARLTTALKVLAKGYTRIIIDSPPILPVSDAALLSKHANSVIYVVKSDSTTVPQIKTGLDLLARVNAPITGIVLNQIDTRKAERYGDYGYAGYYGPDQSKESKVRLVNVANG